MRKTFLISVGLVFIFLTIFWAKVTLAVDNLGMDVTGSFTIVDSEAVDGDILVNSANGLARTKIPYDSNIFGVLTDKPSVVFRTADVGTKPVVRGGVAKVNVIGSNGVVAKGDYVTSSETLGKAMKVTRSGYVLGVALESASGQDEQKISVAIRIEYVELTTTRNANRLFELLGASFLANVKDPEKFGTIVRYILAGFILLGSLTFGFVTFSRAIPKGIEAIGRNPLAKNTIYFSMALNVGLIAIVGILGIVGSLLILRL